MILSGAVRRAGHKSLAQKGYAWGIALAAALGGLLFGYDWVVIGGARQFYEQYFHLTSASLIGWANSSALVGCLLGSLAAGLLASRFGRRPVLILAAILFAASSGFTGWAYSFDVFVFWRIVGGIAIGLSSNVSPLYIAEVSPAAIRGRMVSLNQFCIVVGILLAQVTNWLIARPVPPETTSAVLLASWNVQYGWRWMFTAVIAPSLIFTVASICLPESPRWLLVRGRASEARAILERISGGVSADEEILKIQDTLARETGDRHALGELFAPGVRRALIVGIGLAVLQQWTGINILFNYAGDVYRSAGHGTNAIFLDIVVTGAINLFFTIVSMMLVDRIGRRPMIITGCLGIAASELLCAWAYHAQWGVSAALGLTLAAIACYAMTLAPVTWVLIAEIFPNAVRSQAVSVAVSALWAASFLLTYSFPILKETLGLDGTFAIYGAICLMGAGFGLFFVRETKGRSLEQIEMDGKIS